MKCCNVAAVLCNRDMHLTELSFLLIYHAKLYHLHSFHELFECMQRYVLHVIGQNVCEVQNQCIKNGCSALVKCSWCLISKVIAQYYQLLDFHIFTFVHMLTHILLLADTILLHTTMPYHYSRIAAAHLSCPHIRHICMSWYEFYLSGLCAQKVK